MRDKIYSPGRKNLIRAHLQGEERERHANRRPRVHDGEEDLRVSGVDEDAAKDQASDPDDRAAEIQWAGLHHKERRTTYRAGPGNCEGSRNSLRRNTETSGLLRETLSWASDSRCRVCRAPHLFESQR